MSSRLATSIAGIPVRVSTAFLAVAIAFGFFAGRTVAGARLTTFPEASAPPPGDWRAYARWLQSHDPLQFSASHPSVGWVVLGGVGVALVYGVSVLAHELGHFLAARAAGVEVEAVELDFAGGFVELHDDEKLTPGRLAAIVAAGPAVSAAVAVAAWIALETYDLPLTGPGGDQSAAEVAASVIVAFAFIVNAAAFVVNLLPLRSLDGGQLLRATRLWAAREGR